MAGRLERNTMKTFSMEDGLKVQEQDLIKWKQLLRPEVYAKVLEAVERQNAELKSKWANAGYEVCRGVDIANIVRKTLGANNTMNNWTLCALFRAAQRHDRKLKDHEAYQQLVASSSPF